MNPFMVAIIAIGAVMLIGTWVWMTYIGIKDREPFLLGGVGLMAVMIVLLVLAYGWDVG